MEYDDGKSYENKQRYKHMVKGKIISINSKYMRKGNKESNIS